MEADLPRKGHEVSRKRVQVSTRKFIEELEKKTGVKFERKTAQVIVKRDPPKAGFAKESVMMRAWIGSNGEVHPTFAGLYAKYRKMVEKENAAGSGRTSAAG